MGKNFLAICLFGFVLSIRPLDAEELNHELIHAAQQRELLYIPFFIWYGIEWVALYFKYKDWLQAYAHIRFEKEAYRHQSFSRLFKYRKSLYAIERQFSGVYECGRSMGVVIRVTQNLCREHINKVAKVIDRMLILLMGDDYDKTFTEKELFAFGYPDVTDKELYDLELEY